jgi:hypothetical protein
MSLDVRGYIRAKIAVGFLPVPGEQPIRMWVGKGAGRPCDGCDRLILDTDVECEVELPAGETVRLHRACFQAWEQLRAPR